MTVQKAIKFGQAVANSGRFQEDPPGSNITEAWELYHEITGAPAYQRQPWCGAALIDTANAGGLSLPPNFIGVYAIQSWGQAHGRWRFGVGGAKAGDVLVIGGPGVHTGFARSDVFETPGGLAIRTEEGNTSPGSEGSQFNGGTYALKVRQAGEIYGYVKAHDLFPGGRGRLRPHKVDRRPAEPQFRPEPKRGALRLWEHGPRVEAVQEQLGEPADGYFGRGTAKAVAAFKKKHDLSGGGDVVGENMLQLLRRLERQAPKYRTLRLGDKGAAVRKLQRRLIAAGYLEPDTYGWRNDDGDFGPVTVRAVKNVEKAIGRKANGTAGVAVWKALTS